MDGMLKSDGVGFKGQSRVILPTLGSCYECSLDMLTPRAAVPMCTLATIPRQPAHCIEWASILEWPRIMGGKAPGHEIETYLS